MKKLTLRNVLPVMVVLGALLLPGCSGGGGGGSDGQSSYDGPVIKGTWDLYVTDDTGIERFQGRHVIDQNGAKFSTGGGCSTGSALGNWVIEGNTIENSWVYQNNGLPHTATLTGTISPDKNEIVDGVWTTTEDPTIIWNWSMVKMSDSIVQPAYDSTLTMEGTFFGQDVFLEFHDACTVVDFILDSDPPYFQFLDDIEINAEFLDGFIGIELETMDKIVETPQTFDLELSEFRMDLHGTLDMYSTGTYNLEESEIHIPKGSITIEEYTSNRLRGSFTLVSEENNINLTGSFDVVLFD